MLRHRRPDMRLLQVLDLSHMLSSIVFDLVDRTRDIVDLMMNIWLFVLFDMRIRTERR